MANSSYERRIEREMQHWGEDRIDVASSWFDLQSVQRYVNTWISGRPDTDWIEYLFARCRPPKECRGLVMGCGHGDLERQLIDRKYCTSLVAFDVSPRAIEVAARRAEEEGVGGRIEYLQLDANAMGTQSWNREFDVVFGPMSIHHFVRLEDCLTAVHGALKDRGLLFINEYIGPSLFQWTDRQIQFANEMLEVLPERYLHNVRKPDELKPAIARPTKSEMIAAGFEAVCSAEILPALKKNFEIVEIRPYGGTILHLVLEAIAGNFDDIERTEDAALLSLCCLLERQLLESGAIDHDHAAIAARKA